MSRHSTTLALAERAARRHAYRSLARRERRLRLALALLRIMRSV